MRVALIQLPHFYGRGTERPPECYPLGLGYISSILKMNNICHGGIDLWQKQLSVNAAIEEIDFSKFDVLAISAYATQYNYLKNLTIEIKQRYPSIPIVCGGAGPTFSDHIILKNTGVDICVLGEGEITFLELLRSLDKPDYVKGVSILRNGSIFRTSERSYVMNIDSLPYPNRELFDFEGIIANANLVRANTDSPHLKKNPRRSADIIAGRGCPYQCNYCSKTFSGCRLRSVENLRSEIRELKSVYKIDHLQFNDELVLLGKRRTLALCDMLKREQIAWSCQGRIDQVDWEILTAMKGSGCIEIGYGIESVSQSILDNMNKGLKADQILPVIEMTKKAGMKPIVQYMYGYPGENDETIASTLSFFNAIDHPFVGFTTTPIPGSKLYGDCLEKGLISDE